MRDSHNKVATVSAEEGFVLIDGPGFATTMSPDAAIRTSELLLEAGYVASGQAIINRRGGSH